MIVIAALFGLFGLVHLSLAVYGLCRQSPNVQLLTGIATACFALSGVLISVYSSNKALDQAKKLELLRTRPIVSVEAVKINTTKQYAVQVAIKNSGSFPATNVSINATISFHKPGFPPVSVTTNPQKAEDVGIPKDENHAISIGQERYYLFGFDVDQENLTLIKEGKITAKLLIEISYSAPGVGNIWNYKVAGKIQGQTFSYGNEWLS